MLIRLGELAVRNSAGAVYTRVQSVKTRKGDQSTTNELVEEKTQLIGIARGLEGQVVAQRISDEDLAFITEKLAPTVEKMIELADDDKRPGPELVNMIKDGSPVEGNFRNPSISRLQLQDCRRPAADRDRPAHDPCACPGI